jgi:hypothetical protein
MLPQGSGVASWLSEQSAIETPPAVAAQYPAHKIMICGWLDKTELGLGCA